MKADIKAQWVKDLRSGKYEQGKGFLERRLDDGTSQFCCLGVLCRQAVKAGVIPAPELHDHGQYAYLNDLTGGGETFYETTALPRKVEEWAGLPPSDLNVSIGDMSAIEANDVAGLSFAEIADLIEQNVPAE